MLTDDFIKRLQEQLENTEMSSNILGTVVSILDDFFNGVEDPDGRLTRRESEVASFGNINLIPSEHQTDCHELLITLCTDRDDFYLRMLETINHCINCRDRTRMIIIATHYWNENDYMKWCEESFYFLFSIFKMRFHLVTSKLSGLTIEDLVPRRAKKKK